MNFPTKLSLVITSAALGACSAPLPVVDAGTDVATVQDTPPAVDAPVCVTTVPPPGSPWCAMNGCPFRPLTLPSCDGRGGYAFYETDYCAATVTVMVIVAGWCQPCMIEAPMIERLVTQGYADRGVRVITVYAQNPDGSAPTDDMYCLRWRDQFHLTSHMTRDPQGLTNVYTPGNAFPSNVIVDQNGNIYDVMYGTERGLSTLTSDIDAVLAAEGR